MFPSGNATRHLSRHPSRAFARILTGCCPYIRPSPTILRSLSPGMRRTYAQETSQQSHNGDLHIGHSTLALKSKARFNEIDIQQLSEYMYAQIFPKPGPKAPQELVKLSRDHLNRHDLLGKSTDKSDPVAFHLPPLQGKSKTLDEHFYKLGMDCANPYLDMAKRFVLANPPPRPRKWVARSGWTKYFPNGKSEPVDAPDETMLCFDVEVLYKHSPYAVMACAVGPTAWYAWLSPWLLGETDDDKHLIPLGDPTVDRIIVGHNVGYDRGRILEEYSLEQTRNCFIDTMSLHVAVNGMCSQQRPTWLKQMKNRDLRDKLAAQGEGYTQAQLEEVLTNGAFRDEEELWVERSSINSLRDVAKFHLNESIDKTARNYFGELDRDGVVEKLDELMDYCAADVAVTHKVYQIVFANFVKVCPHPVSFAALRHLSTVILPVNGTWNSYITNAEATYNKLLADVQERLIALMKKALDLKDQPEKYTSDPWLNQLDWSGQAIRMTKGTKKTPPRIVARQKLPGMPKWFRDLHPTSTGPMNLTVRTRVSPLLLRLCWDGHPLFWSDKYGWCFRVPSSKGIVYTARQMIKCDMSQEKNEALRDDSEFFYFKLPHKDGPTARCTNPLAKNYLAYFESGTLSSEYKYAKEALQMNASCSYWISARARIMSQMVVYEKDMKKDAKDSKVGMILPQLIPMGTVTRRAVENTWLTASNAKKNRVGSELKAMVKAPPGYCFVGADVDSEELWIASLVGDSTFKIHGGNAIGFMTLEGTKAQETDMHSRTAKILGITRGDAKIFNYGRIYGAGLKFASTLLRQFNHTLSENETNETATKLYSATKGMKATRKIFADRPFWRGGTESFVFNKLEEFAEQDRPRTPVLGASITEALMGRFVKKGGFMTSRINWAIQSSGVDYLHLLIVSMDYLIRRYRIEARLAITVHDEIRYLVKEKDKYRAALALQVANLWTRAMFAQQMGIDDLPQACAFFSAVDIDFVLRKEVDLDCITPSHPNPIPPGESLDIEQLLAKGELARLDDNIVPLAGTAPKLDGIPYTPRMPVMKSLDGHTNEHPTPSTLNFIKAQIANSMEEFQEIIKEQKKITRHTTKRKPTRSFAGFATVVDEDADADIGSFNYQAVADLVPHIKRPHKWVTVSEALAGHNGGSTGMRPTANVEPGSGHTGLLGDRTQGTGTGSGHPSSSKSLKVVAARHYARKPANKYEVSGWCM